MSKKATVRALAVLAGGALCITALPLAACKNDNGDSIVIMAEEFSGLFNPFYATSGSDMDVVGLTQLSMLTTNDKGKIIAGDDQATAVKDYQITEDSSGNSTYTFVLKNGLKFSDGKPLTMNDVMFNIYEYLDPVYTGSSTMYSTKIQGLSKYRTQKNLSDATAGNTQQDQDSLEANTKASRRTNELLDVYEQDKFKLGSTDSYHAEPKDMRAAIAEWNVSEAYQEVVSIDKDNPTMADYRAKLLEDYELVLKTFQEELESNFSAAIESFDLTQPPYKEHAKKLENDVFKFFLFEAGYITPVYGKNPTTNKDDKTKIERFQGESLLDTCDTKDKAIKKVFDDKINDDFTAVLTQWGTAGEVLTQFAAEVREIILNNRRQDGQLLYPNVEGIVSLGHSFVQGGATSVTVNNKEYKLAIDHKDDGTPTVSDTYDVLQIKLDGKDPKAIYNFSFSVAPAHYYTADEAHPNGRTIDIKNNNFGVEYASASFQSKVIQSTQHVGVPVGAGPYKATDSSDSDNVTSRADFWNNNYVYYKANHNFMFEVKTEKLQYQYVSSANALDKLRAEEIDFATPQLTPTNSQALENMKKDGFESIFAWQLGYGYVGINAGKVENINLRKAIMSAMQAELATEYYQKGTCVRIDWPMSNQSWAYPTENGSSKPNGKDYLQWTKSTNPDKAQARAEEQEAAKEKINKYTAAARTQGATNLRYKFTIAGSSISEHPTYSVFTQAAELLNECGWEIEVKADSQALTKLSTGWLEVWAAAWGSTIDPDMYQVYHKNSTATSVYAWGYREILKNTTKYREENTIISNLSKLIDQGRATTDEAERTEIYEEAMGLVLDLAVEMPIYQRKNVYAYNAKKIGGLNTSAAENPYTSPLEKIWELEIL